MYASDETQPFQPKDHDCRSNGSTQCFHTARQPSWRLSRSQMRVLLGALGFSLVANAFAVIGYINILRAARIDGDDFRSGFQTDFKPAYPAIKTQRVLFDGSPQFYPDGTMYYPVPSGHPRYIGEPSPEIDENWEALTRMRYWVLSEDEAIDTFGATEYLDFWDSSTQGYIAGFDAQHTLHCLNFLRKSFYPEYYSNMSAVHGDIHRDHCIDHLRQLVLCQGDMTPIPTRFHEGIGRNYIDSNRWHTCRDWSSINDWVAKRFIESKKAITEQTNGRVNWQP